MSFLLDVNALIASVDVTHEFHDAYERWFASKGRPPLATCPLTENGYLRIYGHRNYPLGPGSPKAALPPLDSLRQSVGFQFLPDDLSLADSGSAVSLDNTSSSQLTDIYLLALAKKHGVKLATFDKRLAAQNVADGIHSIEFIPVP